MYCTFLQHHDTLSRKEGKKTEIVLPLHGEPFSLVETVLLRQVRRRKKRGNNTKNTQIRL